MNLQARRISGSLFSAEDKLEVILNSDNQPLASVVHTIELVSGVNVTHGGGGQPGEYLHYKAIERDADSDGIIDYSKVTMALVQEEQGTSVVKVVCQIITKEQKDAFDLSLENWMNEPASDSKSTNPPSFPLPILLESGEITLEFEEDSFV